MKVAKLFMLLLFVTVAFAQGDKRPQREMTEKFHEGCCLNPTFPRPTKVSKATVPNRRLLEALNCATNNRFIGGTANVAKALRSKGALHVAYYYGKFMPEQSGDALTIGVYSPDGKHGVLFDVDWEQHKYFVANLPPLLREAKQWQVGEVNGGLWTYTRMWYLAQEVGSRPRQVFAVKDVKSSKPERCSVFVEDETNWKAGKETYVGESVRQAAPK